MDDEHALKELKKYSWFQAAVPYNDFVRPQIKQEGRWTHPGIEEIRDIEEALGQLRVEIQPTKSQIGVPYISVSDALRLDLKIVPLKEQKGQSGGTGGQVEAVVSRRAAMAAQIDRS